MSLGSTLARRLFPAFSTTLKMHYMVTYESFSGTKGRFKIKGVSQEVQSIVLFCWELGEW